VASHILDTVLMIFCLRYSFIVKTNYYHQNLTGSVIFSIAVIAMN